MKNCVFCLLVLLLTIISVNELSAQNVTDKGFIGGLNLANITGDKKSDSEIRYGMAIGGFVSFPVSGQFSIRPEIFYSQKGFEESYEETDSGTDYYYTLSQELSYRFEYIEIPLLAAIKINDNFNMFIGPYVEIYLDGEVSYTFEEHYEDGFITEDSTLSDTQKIKSNEINSPGFGLIFGLEYVYDQFGIGARYSMGLTDIPDGDVSMKHSIFQILASIYIR